MKPFIDPAFWSDPDIEQNKCGIKLTALWLFTNSRTNLLGICGASESRFTFETGLPKEALQRALEALPRTFIKYGDAVFIVNYIRQQFGVGDKLKKNNFFVALKSLFLSVKDEDLRARILKEYPEFSEGLTKGLPSPRRERKGKEGKGDLQKAEEIYQVYPRREAKPDAIKAILKALDSHPPEFLLERTKLYAATRQPKDPYTPLPASWFNDERYNDDPEFWKPRPASSNGARPVSPFEAKKQISDLTTRINSLRLEPERQEEREQLKVKRDALEANL